MFGIALSIGAIYAFIPIVIILILIAAAVGLSRGGDIFAFLGLGVLASRAQYGGGVGRTIKGVKYKGQSQAKGAGTAIGRGASKKGIRQWKSDTAARKAAVNEVAAGLIAQKAATTPQSGVGAMIAYKEGTLFRGSVGAETALKKAGAAPTLTPLVSYARTYDQRTGKYAGPGVAGAKTPIAPPGASHKLGTYTVKSPTGTAQTATIPKLTIAKRGTNPFSAAGRGLMATPLAITSRMSWDRLRRPISPNAGRLGYASGDFRQRALQVKQTRVNTKIELGNERKANEYNARVVSEFKKRSPEEYRQVMREARFAALGPGGFLKWRSDKEDKGYFGRADLLEKEGGGSHGNLYEAWAADIAAKKAVAPPPLPPKQSLRRATAKSETPPQSGLAFAIAYQGETPSKDQTATESRRAYAHRLAREAGRSTRDFNSSEHGAASNVPIFSGARREAKRSKAFTAFVKQNEAAEGSKQAKELARDTNDKVQAKRYPSSLDKINARRAKKGLPKIKPEDLEGQ